ncbi:MAG TPA: DAK2 domain-containing protein [Candidatus Limnocylindrales bacterium]|nr:DAK2 domain-containing protein [Candidatus Limnocylindrales bacterium]
MARRACDGSGLLGAFRAAVANLEAHVDEVNALNVFPVPDGDTGSNMMATVRAALDEAEALGESGTAERIASAAAFGALMGARGNSGVITSQILRGIAEGLAGKTRFNALDLANALDAGTRAAYGAVAKPVEGTILTVVREASGAAVRAAEQNRDLEAVLGATVDAAHEAVVKTPTLLAILREAGVVDSGGQGLYRLMQGALDYVVGAAGRSPATGPKAGLEPAASVLVAHADEGFGYETMFLLQAAPGAHLDLDAIRRHLESIGDSVLVAGDPAAVKVHVHGERPDAAIAYGLSLGSLSRISVENLDHQARDVRETRAVAFTAEAASEAAGDDANGASSPAASGSAGSSTNGRGGSVTVGAASADVLPLAVVAVAPGEGLAAIFRDFGVQRVVVGGQAANPSTGELLEAVRSVDAREVLVLPNNPNVVLAARQVAELADRPVAVVATRNAAEGFAALLALDPTKDAAENAPQMTEAGRAVQTLSVTAAVRDATIGGRAVKAGQWIVLDPDDGLVACDAEPSAACLAGIAALAPGFELVTLYYGADADLASTEALARRVREVAPSAEVEVVHGGQPHYRYLISAE